MTVQSETTLGKKDMGLDPYVPLSCLPDYTGPGTTDSAAGREHPPKSRFQRSGISMLSSRAVSQWLVCLMVMSLRSVSVEAAIIPDMPDAIVCSVEDPTGTLPWRRLVYYVSAQMDDGRTLFKTLTSDPVVLLVSDEGVVSGRNLVDCDGVSVKILRERGQAFDLTATPLNAG